MATLEEEKWLMAQSRANFDRTIRLLLERLNKMGYRAFIFRKYLAWSLNAAESFELNITIERLVRIQRKPFCARRWMLLSSFITQNCAHDIQLLTCQPLLWMWSWCWQCIRCWRLPWCPLSVSWRTTITRTPTWVGLFRTEDWRWPLGVDCCKGIKTISFAFLNLGKRSDLH